MRPRLAMLKAAMARTGALEGTPAQATLATRVAALLRTSAGILTTRLDQTLPAMEVPAAPGLLLAATSTETTSTMTSATTDSTTDSVTLVVEGVSAAVLATVVVVKARSVDGRSRHSYSYTFSSNLHLSHEK